MSIDGLRGCAARHLSDYTDPGGRRAFRTYDRQGDPTPLTPLDCLAPALLSVRIGWRQVTPLFQPSGPGAAIMRPCKRYWMTANAPRPASSTPISLTTAARGRSSTRPSVPPVASEKITLCPGLKAVAVTKILHRKRPALVPIFDRWVYKFYLGVPPPAGAYGDAPRRLDLLCEIIFEYLVDLLACRSGHETRSSAISNSTIHAYRKFLTDRK